MPLTAETAPRFAEMFPAAAHIFDNLHMMHDVVNDIMVDATVPAAAKGVEIERLLRQMSYETQNWVVPPAISHEEMMMHMPGMPMRSMTVPTQRSDGTWLPQGHPDADMPAMGGMRHGASEQPKGAR